MTREEVKKCIAVMQAYADGKTIQVQDKTGKWNDLSFEKDTIDSYIAYITYDNCNYRIKPSPACRPFKDCEELVAEYCKRFGVERKAYEMPSIWVKHKNIKFCGAINGLYFIPNKEASDNGEVSTDDNMGSIPVDELLDTYTFLDGSPCGVMEEASDASSD